MKVRIQGSCHICFQPQKIFSVWKFVKDDVADWLDDCQSDPVGTLADTCEHTLGYLKPVGVKLQLFFPAWNRCDNDWVRATNTCHGRHLFQAWANFGPGATSGNLSFVISPKEIVLTVMKSYNRCISLSFNFKSHFIREPNAMEFQRHIFCCNTLVHLQLTLKPIFSTYPMIFLLWCGSPKHSICLLLLRPLGQILKPIMAQQSKSAHNTFYFRTSPDITASTTKEHEPPPGVGKKQKTKGLLIPV